MATTDAFFDELIGVHDVTVDGGSNLPRRTTFDFANAVVEDVGGATRVTLTLRPVWLSTVDLAADQNDYTATGFAGATDVPFSMAASPAKIITGFSSTGVAVYQKRVWNHDATENLVIAHSDSGSSAANRVYCPGNADLTITPGRFARIIWDPGANHWWGI